MPAECEYNLRADLEAAIRNAAMQDARSNDTSLDDRTRYFAEMKRELWLCEVEYLETRVHSMPGGVVENPSEQKGYSNIGGTERG